MPSLLIILLLAVVQGAAELLPVSSSAHVILVEHWLGLDPTTPAMTLLLVMLHTGTMFAVIVYFWHAWRRRLFSGDRRQFLGAVFLATAATGVVGGALLLLIEKVLLKGSPHAAVEQLFGNLPLVALSLFAVGIMIVISGQKERRSNRPISTGSALFIGAIQGLCLPLRGFSRSGATISTALLNGVRRSTAEEFSFALAVVLTPAVLVREALRFWREHTALASDSVQNTLLLCTAGMVLAFLAGLVALRLLSNWLENGRWSWFGYYCVGLSGLVLLTYYQNP